VVGGGCRQPTSRPSAASSSKQQRDGVSQEQRRDLWFGRPHAAANILALGVFSCEQRQHTIVESRAMGSAQAPPGVRGAALRGEQPHGGAEGRRSGRRARYSSPGSRDAILQVLTASMTGLDALRSRKEVS
jgi:hypothetical protein